MCAVDTHEILQQLFVLDLFKQLNKLVSLYKIRIIYFYVAAGVDETVVVTLKFSKNRMAVFTCSMGVQLSNDAIIVGTKGTIRVGDHSK